MPAVRFPHLGYATAEGAILRWLKQPGDPVSAGEDLLEIVSEKAISVVVAESDGLLRAIFAEPGAVVGEGETVGWIGNAEEPVPENACRLLGWEEEIAPAPPGLAHRLAANASAGEARPPTGAGPATKDPAALARPPTHGAGKPSRADRAFLKGQIRRVTGRRMARAWQAPKVDLFTDVDFSRVVAHRQRLKDGGGGAPSYNVYIAHAVARAFEEFPELNINWIDGGPVPLPAIHVGIAVALESTLITVSMKDVGGIGLGELQGRFKSLIRKAAAFNLERTEIYGSSLTVTNLGEFEITGFTPVLNPPEIFILGIGMLQEKVVPRDGGFAAVPYSTFCLSFDHRGVDGAPASRLLRSIKHNLERYE